MQKMKMPIITSVIVIALIAAGLGMGTMAYFNDKETSVGNIFTSGTLDIKVDMDPDGAIEDWQDNAPTMNTYDGVMWDISTMKPGDEIMVIVGVKNFGSIDGTADLHFIITGETDGDADGARLDSNIDIEVSYGDKSDIGDAWDMWTYVTDGSLRDLHCVTIDAPVPLEAGVDDYWVIEFSIDSSVGNVIQGDSVTFDIEFTLHQEP